MQRRAFMQQAVAGAAAVGLGGLSACRNLGQVSLRPKLAGNEATWTFVGSKDWSQDEQGVFYSPVWTECITKQVSAGNDLLKREDFAYPTSEVLGDTDLSVEFRTYIWSVDTAGVVFGAQDSTRYYYVELGEPGGEWDKYDLRVVRRDSTGYRHDLASAFVPHAKPPAGWYQMVSSGSLEEWAKVTPG